MPSRPYGIEQPAEAVPGPLTGYRVYRFGRRRLLPLFHRAEDDCDALAPAGEAGYTPARCANSYCTEAASQGVPCAAGSCGWYCFRDWRRAAVMWLDVFNIELEIPRQSLLRTDDGELRLEASVSVDHTAYVLAQVAVWGRVAVAEHGYRSQFCYPTRLWALGLDAAHPALRRRQQSLEAAARDYGAPLEWVPMTGELLAWLYAFRHRDDQPKPTWFGTGALLRTFGQGLFGITDGGQWFTTVLPDQMPASGAQLYQCLLEGLRKLEAEIRRQTQHVEDELRRNLEEAKRLRSGSRAKGSGSLQVP